MLEPAFEHPAHGAHGKRRWQRWLPVAVPVVLGAVILTAVGVTVYRRYVAAPSGTGSTVPDATLPGITIEQPTPKPTTEASPLDGTQVAPELAHRRPLAVMVENHPDARPQAGLGSAANVWEAITEGGITRFMAVFGPHDADKIGPVRSARPYFIAWASGYQALYAHAGGSQAGLALLAGTKNVVDLPHSGSYFHREPRPGIATEHTLFTSSSELYAYADAKQAATDTQDFEGFKFQDDAAVADRPEAGSIAIKFSSASYEVRWEYHRDTNSYRRSLAGTAHTDKNTGEQITTKNVAVLRVDRRYDPNTNQGKGEWFMTTEGSGKATLFRDGQTIEATWKKPSQGEMLKLYGADGAELAFDRGQIWFEVAPPEVSVVSQ